MRLFRRCSTPVQRLDRRTRSSQKKLSRLVVTLVVAAVACGVLFGFEATGQGREAEARYVSAGGDVTVAALRDYVQLLAAAPSEAAAAKSVDRADKASADQTSDNQASEDQQLTSTPDDGQRGSPSPTRAGDVQARDDEALNDPFIQLRDAMG